MNIKTNDLSGLALNWAAALAAGQPIVLRQVGQIGNEQIVLFTARPDARGNLFAESTWSPSTDWAQGGPIIEREFIYLIPHSNGDDWFAHKVGGEQGDYEGPTPLVAAMRCYVAAEFGESVNVPEDLARG